MPAVNFNEGTNVKITINKGPLDGGLPNGGSNTVQYNNNGVFGGVSGVTSDGTKLITSNANIRITGGSSNQVLKTDGSGNLSWTNVNASAGGNNTQVQYNNNGVLNGISGVTSDGTYLYLNNPSVLQIGGASAGATLVAGGAGGIDSLTWGPSILEIVNISVSAALADVPPPEGANGAIQYKIGNGFAGTSDLSYISNTLVVGNSIAGVINIGSGSASLSPLTITNAPGSTGIFLPSSNSGVSGSFTIQGGTGATAGDINVIAPTNIANTLSGNITLSTKNLSFRLDRSGAIGLNSNFGTTGQVLTSNGNAAAPTWTTVTSNPGTVTQVQGSGSGLGFSLTGNVTSSGNITLATPDAANLRTSLNIGNIANLNLNGSNTQYLNGSGTWATIQTNAGGANTEIQFNSNGIFGASNLFTYSTATNTLTVANIASVDSMTFDTASTVAVAPARFVWNDGDGTLDLGLKGGNVTAHVGQNLYTLVHNGEATTITKGQVVYIFSAQGQRPSVKLALANADVTSARTMGVVAETIAAGAEGFICIEGDIDNINTDGLTEGGQLYLSPTIPGGYTQNKPSAPNHMVYVGIVLKANATSGRIQVKVQNGYELDELHDVAISNVATSDMLQYDGATSLWKNSNVATVRTSLSIGNVANLNLNGNVSEFLTGNGTFASVPQTTPSGANGEIQFNFNNAFSSSSNLTFDTSNVRLRVGQNNFGALEVGAGSNAFLSINGATITGAGPVGVSTSASDLSVIAGASQTGTGGTLKLIGGVGVTPGDVYLEVGSNPGGTAGGKIQLVTYGVDLQVLNSGAISVNGNVGTSGQVLTSSGNSAPTWTTPSGGGGGETISPFLLMGA